MGCFQGPADFLLFPGATETFGFGGEDKQPGLQMPAAPQYKQASELLPAATNWASKTFPLAYGARESALTDIGKGTEYYSGFQPTSFEQALGNQYFQNVWPDTQRQIKQGLSLSGIESSPVLGEMLGKQYGNLSTSIGSYLSDLGNQRAINSLNARLGIDPAGVYGNYLTTDVNQSNMQQNSSYQYALMKAQNDYQNAMQNYQQQQAQGSGMGGLLGTAGGAGIAAALGPVTGGASLAYLPMAASLGGSLGSSMGGQGGQGSPLSFSDALSLMGLMNRSNIGKAVPVSGVTQGSNTDAISELLGQGGQNFNLGGDLSSLLNF